MLQYLKPLKELMDVCSENPLIHSTYMHEPQTKWNVIKTGIAQLVFTLDFKQNPTTNESEIQDRQNKILDFINSHYQNLIQDQKDSDVFVKGNLIPWRLHDTHFHVDLKEYIQCPFTCMPEISEMLEKIIKKIEEI